MYMNILDKIIENVYNNSKLKDEDLSKMIKLKQLIKDKITCFFNDNYISIKYKILDQGSYKLNTLMYLPDENEDIDMDISIFIYFSYNYKLINKINKINEIRKKLETYLNKELYIFDVNVGKCAITLTHKIQNIHFDIVFYDISKIYGQQIFYNNSLYPDAKHEEMENIIEHLKGDKNNSLKKIICFLKFIYKSIQLEKDRNLPSIAIVELVVQNYKKLENYCSKTLLKILKNGIQKLNKNFVLLTSNETKENLLNNKRRILNKENTLTMMKLIYNGLFDIYNNKKFIITDKNIKNFMTMSYILMNSENKYIMLDEYDYYSYKLIKKVDNNYKKSKLIKYLDDKLINSLYSEYE